MSDSLDADKVNQQLREDALAYHQFPRPGKIAIKATKPMVTQRDLALAYSPGVAFPCEEIAADPGKARDYTSRGNVVAVISNGTAVLGLGAIGALASKPVMEGKAVLFKKFADIDSLDIEIDETDVDKLVDIIASLEPSFGGINLEDIKAPECFEVEKRLKARMNIPVFHDDQHGTAIIVGAAFTNWLRFTKRDIKEIKLVANGAGASALACLNILVGLGLPKNNITVCDREGVIYKGRKNGMDPYKAEYAVDTNARTLKDALEGADVLLGLSAAGAVKPDMLIGMHDAPLLLTLANPTPEIMPELARQAKPNAIICTGRSDYPNQVNNVLCFPFIFRGALDVGATQINEAMKLACVQAIADLALEAATAEVSAVYANEQLEFGAQYLIPKPFDPRLINKIPVAVAKAAMATGMATRPIEDLAAYEQSLEQIFFRTTNFMRPIFERAKADPKRIVFAEGEEERVLHTAQTALDEGIAKPILIGRRAVVERRIKKLRLPMQLGKDIELVDPEDDPRYRDYWTSYYEIMQRSGVTEAVARQVVRTNPSVIGALMVKRHEADALICGVIGQFHEHKRIIESVIGLGRGVETLAAMPALISGKGPLFLCDTHINPDPSVSQIVEMTMRAVNEIRRFGVEPRVALLSHSNFGTHDDASARKMREAVQVLRLRDPSLEVDGEMHADTALSEDVRKIIMPNCRLTANANLLIFPNVDSANITYNAVKIMGDGTPIGPLLLGVAQPAHIVTSAVSVRGLLNAAALATVGAQVWEQENGPLARWL